MTKRQIAHLNKAKTFLHASVLEIELLAADDETSYKAKAEQYDNIVGAIHPYWMTKQNMTAAQAVDHLVEEWRVRNISS